MISIQYRYRRLAWAVSIVFIFVCFIAAYSRGVDRLLFTRPAYKTTDSSDQGDDAICRQHGYKYHLRNSDRPRRVYDLFMISTELDWLEIRLNTIAPYVDYFVIVESDKTFTGQDKPLSLKDNWDKFSEFHGKIIHVVVPDPGDSIGTSPWDHENYLRNAMLTEAFPTVDGTDHEVREGDVLIVSDTDEIPKPETLDVLRRCEFPERLTLRSNFYYYSFQWRHVGKQWQHPQATVYHGMEQTILPNDLRHGIGGPSSSWSWIPLLSWLQRRRQMGEYWGAAWHCSSCFSTLNEMLIKMGSFSHTSLNTEHNRDAETIVDRVRNGLDLFGRWGENYERVEDNRDVPGYILQHPDQYGFMLNRDGEDAGFTDYHEITDS